MELKNLEIIDNTNEGLGVAKSEEGIVFVKCGLVGDIVNVEITQKKKDETTIEEHIKSIDNDKERKKTEKELSEVKSRIKYLEKEI